jgi:hypothetical protein
VLAAGEENAEGSWKIYIAYEVTAVPDKKGSEK